MWRRFDYVSVAEFESDCLVAQRFSEFDLDRVHKRTPCPTLLIRCEPEQRPGLPLGDEERARTNRKAICIAIVLEQEIARQRKFGE